ncbi:MAG TPA: glycoside hydrolase family 15 protein, partial [Acidimicrobiia bacterium]|nr:glycoside hydrolase family 15 protein [Acidimicrobiia bacterium]
CFAALLGNERNGRWLVGPSSGGRAARRRYRDGTLVLETEYDTPEGTVRVTDCMPIRDRSIDIVRVVEGVSGAVPMKLELWVRFDYGSVVPWVRAVDHTVLMIAGPNALRLTSPFTVEGRDFRHEAEFTVRAGDKVPFVLTWYPSYHKQPPPLIDPFRGVARTTAWWQEWSARATYEGEWRELVQRSLLTLKALTYAPTGGIVAAPTTSVPEWPGSVRNWDYRYCWLRDATFTLYSLMMAGYVREAVEWRDWLLRAVAGDPAHLQIMYGAAGERRLDEYEVDWLPGYENSRPVRVGNAASTQFQLDVYGEVFDALHQTRKMNVPESESAWSLQCAILEFLEAAWQDADEGIWEVRGGRQDFTHSKVMAWVAFDRTVKAIEEFGLDGPVDRWRDCRDMVHREVLEKGFDTDRNTFTQYYGSKALDASTLMIPLVGFLPPDDPRVAGTVEAIERELLVDGFVLRYDTAENVDGLPPGEGVFLPCSFWLADNLFLIGRERDGRALFERLLALGNDVGLFAEEYDPKAQRMLGNFPQAFTHVSLVNTACNLEHTTSPATHRATGHRRARE